MTFAEFKAAGYTTLVGGQTKPFSCLGYNQSARTPAESKRGRATRLHAEAVEEAARISPPAQPRPSLSQSLPPVF